MSAVNTIFRCPFTLHLGDDTAVEVSRENSFLLLSSVHLGDNTRVEVRKTCAMLLSRVSFVVQQLCVHRKSNYLLSSSGHLGNNTRAVVSRKFIQYNHLVCMLRITPECRSPGNTLSATIQCAC